MVIRHFSSPKPWTLTCQGISTHLTYMQKGICRSKFPYEITIWRWGHKTLRTADGNILSLPKSNMQGTIFFWKIRVFSFNEWSPKSCNTKHQKPRQKTRVYTKINKTLWGPRGVPNMSCCFPMIFISSLGICWKKSNQDLELLGKIVVLAQHTSPNPKTLESLESVN